MDAKTVNILAKRVPTLTRKLDFLKVEVINIMSLILLKLDCFWQ